MSVQFRWLVGIIALAACGTTKPTTLSPASALPSLSVDAAPADQVTMVPGASYTDVSGIIIPATTETAAMATELSDLKLAYDALKLRYDAVVQERDSALEKLVALSAPKAAPAPVPVRQAPQPVYYQYQTYSSGCSNGQCGRGFLGRR